MDEKIAKLYQNLKQEGIDDVRARDIIQKIEEYYDCLSDFNLEELDYIGALKAIQYGRFLKSNNASGDNTKVWNDAKVYSDDNVVIWKPKNFQDASIIGIPQWCVSAQDYHWNDHANCGDTIYMIYCGWESGNRQFVSACVERNGNIILYESGHDRIEGVEKEQYLKNLGNGLSVLKPSNNRLNCNLNMNKKLIRLTESDLHRIVKEAVNKVLNETLEGQEIEENAENEGFGKWMRAGIEAAGKKQRTNPQMQSFKQGFGSSLGNWWERTKANAQHEDDMNYLNNVNRNYGGPKTQYDQMVSNRARNHRMKEMGSDTRYTMRPGATDNGGYNPLSYSAGNGNYNYNHRNGTWSKEENPDDDF